MSAVQDIRTAPLEGHGENVPYVILCSVALVGSAVAFKILKVDLAFLVAGWCCLTLVIVRSDLENFIIPNWASAGIATLAIVYAIVSMPLILLRPSLCLAVAVGLIGRALAAFVCAAAFGWTFSRIAGKESLGFGDVKLCAALALWLNAYNLILAIEVASLAALALVAIGRLRRRPASGGDIVAFGAFLAPAAWLVFVYAAATGGVELWRAGLG